MKKMSFLRITAGFAVAGAMFLATQTGFAQDDLFDFFGAVDTPVTEAELPLPDLAEADLLGGDEATDFGLSVGDTAAITGEGILEEPDQVAPQEYVAPKTSPILSPAPEAMKATTVPVLPPPATPKTALIQVPQPAPQQPAPMAAAPAQQPQPSAVSYQNCPGFYSPGLFQGRCRGAFATGRQAAERFAPAATRAQRRDNNSRQPMIDPYYTLRGPRHFDDPNPRPIGP